MYNFTEYETISLADKLPVSMYRLLIHNVQLVYLSLIGNPTNLKASWAYIKNGGGYKTVNEHTVKITSKAHQLFKSTELPNGLYHWVILHKSASWVTMERKSPFYLLDFYNENTKYDYAPAQFYPLLNTALSIPIRPEWTQYLWERGRSRHLIRSLSDKDQDTCLYQMGAVYINPDTRLWSKIINDGFRHKKLSF